MGQDILEQFKMQHFLSILCAKFAKVRSHIAHQKISSMHAHRTHSSKSLYALTSAHTSHVRKCDITHMCAATQNLIKCLLSCGVFLRTLKFGLMFSFKGSLRSESAKKISYLNAKSQTFNTLSLPSKELKVEERCTEIIED